MVLIIAIIVIIVLIAALLVLYSYKYKSKRKIILPDRLPCNYCGTEVSRDFIIMWSKGNFDGAVCGKKKCLELYKKNHETLTNNEQTNI